MMKRLLFLSLLLMPAYCLADDAVSTHPYFDSKFYASVGIFLPDQDMKLKLDGSVTIVDPTPAPHIDFDQTFGTSSSDETFSAEIGWRFGKKWQLRGQYFRVDNDVEAVLEEDIEWGDYEFSAGANVSAGSDMQITRLFFGRTLIAGNSQELGIGLGGHILDVSAFISGDATIDGVPAGFVQERASVSQPLPNFGAWYMHAFSPKLAVLIRVDWLSASYDRYDGRIVNSALSFGYTPTDHFGIGVEYNFFEIDFNVSDPDWNGGIRARFNGPYISLTGYW